MTTEREQMIAEVNALLEEIDPRAIPIFQRSEDLRSAQVAFDEQQGQTIFLRESDYDYVYVEDGRLHWLGNAEEIRGFVFVGNPPQAISAVVTTLGTTPATEPALPQLYTADVEVPDVPKLPGIPRTV